MSFRMGLDRTNRDVIAQSLIGYLRNELTLDELRRDAWKTWLCVKRDANGVPVDLALSETCLTLKRVAENVSSNRAVMTQYDWEATQRWLALLRSDVEMRLVEIDDESSRRLLALNGTLGVAWLTLIVAAAAFSNGVLLIAGWLVLGLLWFCGSVFLPKTRATVNPEYPFRNEKQWQACRPLIEALGLPAFDPARYPVPCEQRVTVRRILVGIKLLFFLLLACIAGSLFALVSAFSRPKLTRAEAVGDNAPPQ